MFDSHDKTIKIGEGGKIIQEIFDAEENGIILDKKKFIMFTFKIIFVFFFQIIIENYSEIFFHLENFESNFKSQVKISLWGMNEHKKTCLCDDNITFMDKTMKNNFSVHEHYNSFIEFCIKKGKFQILISLKCNMSLLTYIIQDEKCSLELRKIDSTITAITDFEFYFKRNVGQNK